MYQAAGVVDDVAFDGDAQQLPFSILDVVAEVNVRRSVDHIHLPHTSDSCFVHVINYCLINGDS